MIMHHPLLYTFLVFGASLYIGSRWPSGAGTLIADILSRMNMIQSIQVHQLSMDFTGVDDWRPLLSSSDVAVELLSIPGIDQPPIKEIRQRVIIEDNGVDLGYFETPWTPVSIQKQTLKASIGQTPLVVYPRAHDAFSSFISALSVNASHAVILKGSVDVIVDFGSPRWLNPLRLDRIRFHSNVILSGLQNLPRVEFKYFANVDFNWNPLLYMNSIISVTNPSALSLTLGDLTLDTFSVAGEDDAWIGRTAIKNLTLVPGQNLVVAKTLIDSKLVPATEFLTRLSDQDGTLHLKAFNGSSVHGPLNQGLALLSSSVVLPRNFQGCSFSQFPYDANWSLRVLPTTRTDRIVEITTTFRSPYFGFPLKMTHSLPKGETNVVTVNTEGHSINNSGLVNTGLFHFHQDNLQFSVTGHESIKMTFQAKLRNTGAPFTSRERQDWQMLVKFAAEKGYLPVKLSWIVNVIVNEGQDQQAGDDDDEWTVDWGTDAAGLEEILIKVGPDFASVLDAIPA